MEKMEKFEPKLLMIDKDKTCTKTISGKTFPKTPQDQQLIDGVYETAQAYSDAGWKLVIVSNQGGVQKKYKSMEFAIAEMQHCLKLLPQIEAAYFCPDYPNRWLRWIGLGRTTCRKVERSLNFGLYKEWEVDEEALRRGAKGSACSYRKPGIYMLELAYQEYALRSPNANLLMVGDRKEDALTAQNFGCDFLDVKTWIGSNPNSFTALIR